MNIKNRIVKSAAICGTLAILAFTTQSCNSETTPTDLNGTWTITSGMGIPTPSYNDEVYAEDQAKAKAAIEYLSSNWTTFSKELTGISELSITLPSTVVIKSTTSGNTPGTIEVDNTYESPKYFKITTPLFEFEISGIAADKDMEIYYPKSFILDTIKKLIEEGKIEAGTFDYEYYNKLFKSIYAVVVYKKSSTTL